MKVEKNLILYIYKKNIGNHINEIYIGFFSKTYWSGRISEI